MDNGENLEAQAIALEQQSLQFINSICSLADAVSGVWGGTGNPPTISGAAPMIYNMRWYFISNFRQVLSQLYVEHGIVQTLIDQPVDDGFRPGFEIKTSQLDANEIEQIYVYEQKHHVIENVKQAIKWARLYGGGAVMIITDQNPATPLNIKAIGEDTPLEFRAVDMWELYANTQNSQGTMDVGGSIGEDNSEFYNYYGMNVHKSRVYTIKGREAPSFIRQRLRGWGMSEVERLVRSLNQYLKNQDVVFELLDEAKIDVYKMDGFNAQLMDRAGVDKTAARITASNRMKNYQNAITMDKDDEYEQKTMSFAGLPDILVQIRQGIACDVRMPVTKLFGTSAAGFSSGEDDIENYNSMIDSEIRAKSRNIVADILQIVCQKLYGFTMDDLIVNFKPLRILNANEEEDVKDKQFNRVMAAFTSGLMDAKEAKQAMNKNSLMPVEVDENREAAMPLGEPDQYQVGEKNFKGKTTPEEA